MIHMYQSLSFMKQLGVTALSLQDVSLPQSRVPACST
jgi:hypothetical protein